MRPRRYSRFVVTPRFVARQLSFPRGILGRVIVRLMNRGNANINAYALRQLSVTSEDRVLEVGFGGGLLLKELIETAAFTAGLDRSPYAIKRARARFSAAIERGRADFREGNVQALPFEPASFTRAITVHTVYFWNDLTNGFQQIHGVLCPGGKLVVGFLPREKMERLGLPGDVFTMRTPEEVTAALQRAGFGDIRIERPREQTPWNVFVATRQ